MIVPCRSGSHKLTACKSLCSPYRGIPSMERKI
nr:MAG TPA: hypothetical protein [Caudoviricetes sp.]